MKKDNIFKWFARNILNILGGLCIGFSIPTSNGYNILPIADFVIFLPLGIILLGISFYYIFVEKKT